MTLDTSLFYALREEAGECLVGNVSVPAFVDLIEALRRQGSQDATRLASNLLLEAGVDHFADQFIVDEIMRSVARRVGQECVSTCRSQCSQYHYKKPVTYIYSDTMTTMIGVRRNT